MLYQINTRVVLGELHAATLDLLPDSLLDSLVADGFEWVWLLGVWQTGPMGRKVSQTYPAWQAGFREVLPDLRPEDISGSPYAVQSYTANTDFGGEKALAQIRERLRKRGLRLMLDLVPNHVALDHPWATSHPEWFIHGNEEQLHREPANWIRREGKILAHGRDPYFPGWPDTLQLNYFHPGLKAAMRDELLSIARRCDGVRCDMSMLLLPEVFSRTWGALANPADGTPADKSDFWPEATAAARRANPDFVLMAEVYWDLEWEMQQRGFDYTYDKRLYDRLREGHAEPVRGHLRAGLDFQNRCARFMENHDEPRAASAFAAERYRAAAVVTYLTPGLKFFHEGQFEGRKVHVSIHLGRRPTEPVDHGLQEFYRRLLPCLTRREVREGCWQLLDCRRAWADNPTAENFIVSLWHADGEKLLVAVNYGPTQGQCTVALPGEMAGRTWELRDLLGDVVYVRDGDALARGGLYLDMPAWGYHAFAVGPGK